VTGGHRGVADVELGLGDVETGDLHAAGWRARLARTEPWEPPAPPRPGSRRSRVA
jgi:hypothetical protein